VRRFWLVAVIASAVVSVASCVGDDPGISGAEGDEGGPCYPNGTCNQGLTCVSTRCVALDGGGIDEGGADVADTDTAPVRDGGPDTSSWLRYGAILNTAQVVPTGSVDSGASGTFAAVLDPVTGRFCGVLQAINLSSTDTQGHVHTGQIGMNGGLHTTGNRVDAGRYVFDTVFGSADRTTLDATGFYIDVHTLTFPGGEVRGMVSSGGDAVTCP
jgi:hypothetical protein